MFLVSYKYDIVNTDNINFIQACRDRNNGDDELYDIIAEYNEGRVILYKHLKYDELQEKLDYLCRILKAEQLY